MLTANLSALEFLPDTGKPFSIRDWIGDEDRDRDRGGDRGVRSFLFLTSRGDQHASLRGLISTWLEIAVNAMLTLAQDDGRRIWVTIQAADWIAGLVGRLGAIWADPAAWPENEAFRRYFEHRLNRVSRRSGIRN